MLRPGVRSAACGALLAGSAAIACDSVVEPVPCAPATVVRSNAGANPDNVLSAIVTARVDSADSVSVRFGIGNGAMDNSAPAAQVLNDSAFIPVLGLTPGTNYDIQVVAFNRCGETTGAVLPFTTGVLPSDLPKYTAAGTDPSPGYIAFAAGNYGVVIDNAGRIIWYHRFPGGPGLNFQPQPNGRYAARPAPATPADLARWVEIDPLGNVTRTLGCARALQPRLHDLLAQPNGSYWIMCDETRTLDLSTTGGPLEAVVMGTVIQHISATGDLLFEWSPFDRLELDYRAIEPGDQTGGVINWTHGNAIDLDADGNLLVSFRNLSQVVKIDTRTGGVVWRMGGPGNDFTFQNAAAPAFARQHGVRSTAKGQLVLLDNLGDPRGSRVERYEYDETVRTVRQVASYPSSTGAIALIGGTTQSLPGGRTLVSFGNGGSVEESDAAGNIVWRIEGNPGYVFRAQRLRSLYRPGAGDPR